MSRIGKAPVQLPAGVTVNVSPSNLVKVKGPKGELTQQVDPGLQIQIEEGTLSIARPNDDKVMRSQHGLSRALIANMVTGVTEGFTLSLEAIGVGYRASNTGQLLELSLGYSHPIMFLLPEDVKLETVTEKGKNPRIVVSGIDKQLVGQIAAKIRSFRKPEPYKGKGVRFMNEVVRRKAGKTSGKK